MKIRPITGVGTSGYEFKTNLVEMETLVSLDERAAEVCESFKSNKPSYFTKEECQLIHAVLSTFVADYKRENENAFISKFKEQTEEKKEKPQTPAEECHEVLIKCGPSPDAELPLEMTRPD